MAFFNSTNDPRQVSSGKDLIYGLVSQILVDEEYLQVTLEDLAPSPLLNADNDIADQRAQNAEGRPEPTDLAIDV